ncbi:MAG: hypothetical protein Q8R15_03370, partial [Candidatus Micrarchaeota archaeon]|nr:hypothetical protein [Candidatus Micrarchaeota archaeon]
GATVELSTDSATKLPFEQGKNFFFTSIAPEFSTSKNVIIKNQYGSQFCSAILQWLSLPSCSPSQGVGPAGELRGRGSEVWIAGAVFSKTSATNNAEASHKLFVPGQQPYDIEFKPDTPAAQQTFDQFLRTARQDGRWMVNRITSRPAKSYLVEKYSSSDPSGNYAELLCEYPAQQTAAVPEPAASLTGTCAGTATLGYQTGGTLPALSIALSVEQGSPNLPANGKISGDEFSGEYNIGNLAVASKNIIASLVSSQNIPSYSLVTVSYPNGDAFCTLQVDVINVPEQCSSSLVFSANQVKLANPSNPVGYVGYGLFIPRLTSALPNPGGEAVSIYYSVVPSGADFVVQNLNSLPTTKTYLVGQKDSNDVYPVVCFYPPATQTAQQEQQRAILQGQCSATAEPVYYVLDNAVRLKVKVSTPRGMQQLPQGAKINVANQMEQVIESDIQWQSVFSPIEIFSPGSPIPVTVKNPPDFTNTFCTAQPATFSAIAQCATTLTALESTGLQFSGFRADDLVGSQIFVPGFARGSGRFNIVQDGSQIIARVNPVPQSEKIYLLEENGLDVTDNSYAIRCYYPPLQAAAPQRAALNGICQATGRFVLETPTSPALDLLVNVRPTNAVFPGKYTVEINNKVYNDFEHKSDSASVLSTGISVADATVGTFVKVNDERNNALCETSFAVPRVDCDLAYGHEGGLFGWSVFGTVGYPTITSNNMNLNLMRVFQNGRLYRLSQIRTGVWKVEDTSELAPGFRYLMEFDNGRAVVGAPPSFKLVCSDDVR